MIAFLDIETGGFCKEKNAICSIGIVIVNKEMEIVDKYYATIKPYYRENSKDLCSYKEDAMRVNGLSIDELNSWASSKINEVMEFIPYFLEQQNVTHLAGHNIDKFDLPWLNYLLQRFLNITLSSYKIIDTLTIARSRGYAQNDLKSLCDMFNIRIPQHHNAIYDAMAAYELYKRLTSTHGGD